MAGSPVNESAFDLERPDSDGCVSDVTDLKVEVERLRCELRTCQSELQKVQKQFDQCVRLQKSTESYNQDLRVQVEKLSSELHEWKKRERNRVEAETQTEGYGWVETDYSYYYDGYYQQTDVTAATAQDALQLSQQCDTTTEAPPTAAQPTEDVNMADTEVGDGVSSLADLLKATAEQALSQTGFVFDENSGMYYDHSTGFYYDSNSQLYYDASTGIYYCYDAESGKYQFHSRVELTTVQLPQTGENPENMKPWRSKRSLEKAEQLEIRDLSGSSEKTEARKLKEQRGKESRKETLGAKKKRRSRSRTRSSRPRSRTCASRSRSSHSGKTRKSKRAKPKKGGSQDRDTSHSDKRKKKKRSESHRDPTSHSEDGSSRSEAEEGEITGSEGEKESSSSSSSSSFSASPAVSPAPDSPVRGTPHPEEGWPPCVRVTVVRSPVLQTGTLFILTADAVATIGREKDMDHAIRIPEMGVSKSHAEVYFDADHQGYMLVDQGSQNGTVLNGTRISQPKVRCDPCPLSHGDEVKLGETVLSFHIHSGSDTCNGCEPGQVRAHLSRQRPEDNTGCQLVKEDKEEKRQRELKLMKLKYGLKNSEYEDNAAVKSRKYKDRAESRRQTVGSEGTFYRDEAPSSVHVEISEKNKGRQMLQKMGWKHGEGLGKDGDGITEPIELRGQRVQSGLGSGGSLSVDELSLGPTKKQQNWEQARERYRAQHSDGCSSKPALHWIRQQPAE